jgi:tetratricopeptide (TPR) repeat protein
LALAFAGTPLFAQSDSGVIRLRPVESLAPEERQREEPTVAIAARRGFDFEAFDAKLEALWFQRKALLADGRNADAARQAELILSLCKQEGVQRLDYLAAALLVEANHYLEEDQYERALDALNFASSFNPHDPRLNMARASVYWQSDQGYLAAGAELLHAAKAGVLLSVRNPNLVSQLVLALVVALVACVALFSVFMVVRYNVPFRHEVGEVFSQYAGERWLSAAGWALLFLPLLVWFAAGWIALYWIVITFRFMTRTERLTAVGLLAACALVGPTYRVAVTLYGTTADPLVRTTLEAAKGEYGPERVLKLRRLVEAYPEDPVYRFLLAGLYKNGRYFEEAFAEYNEALQRDSRLVQAHINIGNIFYTTGQYGEAIASYHRALDQEPNSLLAHFNLHLAQSESFRFKDAEASLERARLIDAKQVAEMLSKSAGRDSGPAVADAQLNRGSIWDAALDGRTPREVLAGGDARSNSTAAGLFNVVSAVSMLSILMCGAMILLTQRFSPARRCIRCGGAFCHYCKSSREGHEYCSQCLHLFVRGDGLAPEAKNYKLYQVERFEQRTKRRRRLVSLLLPGAGQLLRGKPTRGVVFLILWMAAWIAFNPAILLPLERLAGLDLRLDLLRPGRVPAAFVVDATAILALALAIAVWFAGNAWRLRRREA